MRNLFLVTFTSLLYLCFFHGNSIVGNLSNAYAQPDWKQEYADICSKTQNVMSLTSKELKDYVDRCDKLQDRINELNGTEGPSERKVYTKRLKMCRDLYDFTLNFKENKE